MKDHAAHKLGREVARINADGTTIYYWNVTAEVAAGWVPGCTGTLIYTAKLLVPFAPEGEQK